MAERGDRHSRLQHAQAEVNALLAELRTLAHGIYPVALAEEGLEAAIEALAEGSGVPLRLQTSTQNGRLDPSAEAAAYLVVREMTRDERRRWASVEMTETDGRLMLEIAGDGAAPADLRHLEDRVGAVGGELRCDSPEVGATRLRVELPCA